VLKECNRLGIVIDLAHADMQTTEAALKVTTRPGIISHTGLDTQLGNNPSMAQMMRPRLISKEQAKMVADAGGVVGVWTHLADTPLEYARNVRALVDVVGVDHVCIGTDTKLTQPSPRPIGPGPGGLPPKRLQLWSKASERWRTHQSGMAGSDSGVLLRRCRCDVKNRLHFTPDEIGKIGGGNFLRVFDSVTSHQP